MAYCGCPVIFRASRKRKDVIEYAKDLGLKCFVIVLHEEGCSYRKVKAAN